LSEWLPAVEKLEVTAGLPSPKSRLSTIVPPPPKELVRIAETGLPIPVVAGLTCKAQLPVSTESTPARTTANTKSFTSFIQASLK
jgi:hypothetical protein